MGQRRRVRVTGAGHCGISVMVTLFLNKIQYNNICVLVTYVFWQQRWRGQVAGAGRRGITSSN